MESGAKTALDVCCASGVRSDWPSYRCLFLAHHLVVYLLRRAALRICTCSIGLGHLYGCN
jgi:hypothetical protein